MGLLLLIFVLAYLVWCRPYREDLFASGAYLAKERTTLINGVFILYVFIAHALGYLPEYGVANGWAHDYVVLHLRQLIVASFLFHSGYGVAESIRRKGASYVDGMPRRRVLAVWMQFAVAVTLYALLQTALGRAPGWWNYALALIGWESVGNSNWYIFDILCLYLCVYAAFKTSCGHGRVGVFLLCMLVLGVMTLMFFSKPGANYWWNTLPCFAAGGLLSFYHGAVRRWVWWLRVPPFVLGVFLLLAVHVAEYLCRPPTALTCIPFAFGVVLALSGWNFRKSPVLLLWLGGALFNVYIYQRMPMIFFSRVCDLRSDPDVFFGLSLAVTLLIAWGAAKARQWWVKAQG